MWFGHISATVPPPSRFWDLMSTGVGGRKLTGTRSHCLASRLKGPPAMCVQAISGASNPAGTTPWASGSRTACSDTVTLGSHLPLSLPSPLPLSPVLSACPPASCWVVLLAHLTAAHLSLEHELSLTSCSSQPSSSNSGRVQLWPGKLLTALDWQS